MVKIGNYMTTIPQLIKLGSAFFLLVIMSAFAPKMIKEQLSAPVGTVSERVAVDEVNIKTLQERVQRLEDEKIGEQLAELRARLEWFGLPLALFVLTHTFETVQRIRGKSRTRATD